MEFTAEMIDAFMMSEHSQYFGMKRNFLNQIYGEIKTIILSKFYMNKSNGELIKMDLPNINEEMQKIADKYSDKSCVDLQFLMGLIYIATSNCAMKWKYGESV